MFNKYDSKMDDIQRVESSRAIADSSRDDFRQYVHNVLDDIEVAETVDNIREVSKLMRILGHKDRRGSCNPSKGADGRTITTSTQLLSECEKFLGTKFQRPQLMPTRTSRACLQRTTFWMTMS